MWLIQNLMRSNTQPSTLDASQEDKLNCMLRAALSLEDDKVLCDGLVATLETIKVYSDHQIKAFSNEETVKRLLSLVQRYSRTSNATEQFELTCTIRLLGEMVVAAQMASQIQILIQNNGLDKLNLLLASHPESIQVEVLWCLSNIACDSAESAVAIIRNDLFQTLMEKVQNSERIEVRKESMITIGNILTSMP